jgi:hypothetical protein
MKTSKLAATFVAAALAATAGIANAATFGDENDASWIYTPPAAKQLSSDVAVQAPKQTVRFSGLLDENGTTSSYMQLN